MECKKYEIIEDGGRKRIRSLRDFTVQDRHVCVGDFTVQDRHVCVGDLGGYVYDERTLAQKGNAWIFSGSLEYPGIHVIDEAIVDMGSNEAFANAARMNRVLIRGNSRIMGMMQFVSSATSEATQTPEMYEQGYYEGYAGVPYEAAAREASDKVRSKVMTWSAGAGKVILPNAEYEIMCNKLDEDGVTLAATAWITGGPDVTIDLSDAPAFVLNVRKKAGGAITPADITAAGFKIQGSVLSKMDLNDVTLSVTYDRAATPETALKVLHANDLVSVLDTADIRISYSPTSASGLCVNCELYRTNAVIGLTPGKYGSLVGTFRDTELITIDPTFLGSYSYASNRKIMSVSDCKEVVLSSKTQPDLAEFNGKNGKLVFRGCNVPVGIFYYDRNPGGNVYEGIDFTKASEHLGKTLPKQDKTILVSSTVEGMYRLYRNADDKVFGMLVQDYASVENMGYGALESSYDSVVYSDCVLDGVFNIIGCNVFGGTLGGASKVQSTVQDAVAINGNFRIEGNAQVVDTPLKGTGYIGGNAELKDGRVEGYIYMQDNARYAPPVTTNKPALRYVIMVGNSVCTKMYDATTPAAFALYDNAKLDAIVSVGQGGFLEMRDNSIVTRDITASALIVQGRILLRDKAAIIGTGAVTAFGDVVLSGNFLLSSGAQTIYGKRVISDVSQIAVVDVPPTKTTW
jgi:hypothetical protein